MKQNFGKWCDAAAPYAMGNWLIALSISLIAVGVVSSEQMSQHQAKLAAIASENPNIQAVNSTVGSGASNTGRIFRQLKPLHDRSQTAEEIVKELRPKLSQIPGIRSFLQAPPAIRIGGIQSKALYQFTLTSTKLQDLYQYVPQLEAKLREHNILQNVNSDLQIKNPEITINIDRDKASALGLSAQQIENTLNNAYSTRQVSTIYAPDSQYQVILGVDLPYQQDINSLDWLTIRANTGQQIPLNTVANVTKTLGPLNVSHLGQLAAVTISFNLKPGASIGEATSLVQEIADSILPSSINSSFQGSAQIFQSSLGNLGFLLGIAILVIYLVLGILYEDFIHPVTILSSLPSAGFGALLTLIAFQVELNIYGFVGIILLVGIVKKNGIMMIDFAIEKVREGKSASKAIYEACVVRFRPIMMTTMAALMGTLPIALGFGAGAQARRSLGLAVVGGLLFSQFLTLYLTPVFYLYMESLRKKFVT